MRSSQKDTLLGIGKLYNKVIKAGGHQLLKAVPSQSKLIRSAGDKLLRPQLTYGDFEEAVDWRQQYRWRRNKGRTELGFFYGTLAIIESWGKNLLWIFGASFGTELFSPQIAARIENWWPWGAEAFLWIASKAVDLAWLVIVFLVVWTIFTKWSVWRAGRWLEKSGVAEAEQEKAAEQFNWFSMKNIVEPLKRIEKRLRIIRPSDEERPKIARKKPTKPFIWILGKILFILFTPLIFVLLFISILLILLFITLPHFIWKKGRKRKIN